MDVIRRRSTQDTVAVKIQRPAAPPLEDFKIRPRQKSFKKIFVFAIIIVLAGGVLGTYRYFFRQGSGDVVLDVSKIYLLPPDETPTIATVTDPNKLKSKIFFANAKNGDKVLIYTKADKVILYRPSENKIINVDWLKASNINTQQ